MRSVFVSTGSSIDHTPGADVAAGDVLVIGDLVAVAERPIAAGKLGALAVEGMRSFPKATGASTALAQGAIVYWNAALQVATTTASTHKRLGIVAAAAVDADATVHVLLGR